MLALHSSLTSHNSLKPGPARNTPGPWLAATCQTFLRSTPASNALMKSPNVIRSSEGANHPNQTVLTVNLDQDR